MNDHKNIVKKLIESFDDTSEDLQVYLEKLTSRNQDTNGSPNNLYNKSLFDSIVKEPDDILGQYQSAVYSLESFFDFIIGRKVNFDHAELSKIELEFLENFLIRIWLLFEPDFNILEINTKDIIHNIIKMNSIEIRKSELTILENYAKPSTYKTVPVLFIKCIKIMIGHFCNIAMPKSIVVVETFRKNIDSKYRLIFQINVDKNSNNEITYTSKKNKQNLNTDAEVFKLLLCNQIIKHLNGKLIIESPHEIIPSFKLIF